MVMNHMAIVVISQFGNFFYMASSEKKWKEVITDSRFGEYLMIQTTTSCLARYKIADNELKKQRADEKIDNTERKGIKIIVPKYIYVNFKDRICSNKVLYLLYKCFRILYITLWFYFLPFVVITLSFVIPLLSGNSKKIFDGDCNSDIQVTT